MISSEFRTRLTARATDAGIRMMPSAIDQLETYFQLLTRWNRTINLTALRLEPPDRSAIDRLLLEPLAAARFMGPASGPWIDLGSGGGSPAIPLKVARPEWPLTMVEARARKTAFLREAARDLALMNVEALTERFETLPDRYPGLGGLHSLVTVRAVKVDAPFLVLCRWLLAPGGQLFLFGRPDLVPVESQPFESRHVVDLRLDGPQLMILS